jgi:Flp pilus assembly protein TadD
MAMSKDELSKLVGDGWDALRSKNTASALEAFRRALSEDKDHIDAHYGLGLAQRESGDKAAARAAFGTAKAIAERELAALRGGSTSNNLTTTRDDRYMILIRMLEQRLNELGA